MVSSVPGVTVASTYPRSQRASLSVAPEPACRQPSGARPCRSPHGPLGGRACSEALTLVRGGRGLAALSSNRSHADGSLLPRFWQSEMSGAVLCLQGTEDQRERLSHSSRAWSPETTEQQAAPVQPLSLKTLRSAWPQTPLGLTAWGAAALTHSCPRLT